ncbi:MAG: hypothetical protein AB8H86_16310 [Polyangiales bacterium]
MRRAAPALFLLLLCACDTELSLAVEVASATAGVRGDVVEIEVVCDVRVGTYALAGDDFILPQASIVVDGVPVAEVSLERPEGFSGRLEPGESTQVTTQGSVPLSAFPSTRDRVCGQSVVEVSVQYQAEQQPDDPLDPPVRAIGAAQGEATVRCD